VPFVELQFLWSTARRLALGSPIPVELPGRRSVQGGRSGSMRIWESAVWKAPW